MAHIYAEFEGTALWASIDAAIGDLEANRDLSLSTARTHVIGYLCRALARAGVANRASHHQVPLTLSEDEALVLFDLLARGGEGGSIVIEHRAEEHVLWRVEGVLERSLVAPVAPDYQARLSAAQERIVSGS